MNESNQHVVHFKKHRLTLQFKKENYGLPIVYSITCRTMFILWEQESYIGCIHYHGGNYEKNQS